MTDIKGSNGVISFDGRTVTISRKGLGAAVWSGGFGAEKQLPISAVSAVQYKKGGLTVGYLQLSVPGELAHKGRNKTESVLKDENTVTFYSKQNDAFKALAEELNAAIQAGSAPTPAAPDITDQLRKLGELRDSGVLTSEEFESKKAQLLERL